MIYKEAPAYSNPSSVNATFVVMAEGLAEWHKKAKKLETFTFIYLAAYVFFIALTYLFDFSLKGEALEQAYNIFDILGSLVATIILWFLAFARVSLLPITGGKKAAIFFWAVVFTIFPMFGLAVALSCFLYLQKVRGVLANLGAGFPGEVEFSARVRAASPDLKLTDQEFLSRMRYFAALLSSKGKSVEQSDTAASLFAEAMRLKLSDLEFLNQWHYKIKSA